MKTKIWFVMGLATALSLPSCVEDKMISNTQLVRSISITGQDFQSGEPETKAAYTVDGTGMHFSWTEGDTVGIYPVGGDQVAFPISSGEGSQTAQFDGGAWALRSSYSYAAYYPYVKGNYMVDETQIPVSFIGQTQNGNGSLDCLDRFDYQASLATNPDADGNVNIELKHLGCFVRFQFTMPIADTYKSITLTSNKIPFITSGTFDLTKDEIAIIPDTSSSSIIVSLNNTFTTGDNKVLTVYAMLAPTDLSDSEISISIEGTTYKSYSATVSGKNMIAGKAYSYSAKVQSGTNINGSDVEWDDEGHELQPPYEYVDLGLSVNWATFNVGATKPEEYGEYYAWGETEPKTSYTWTNYKYRTSGDSNDNVQLYKYVVNSADGSIDNKFTLTPEDDVAHLKWGENWRMPTNAEQEELINNCTWTWTTLNNVKGYMITSNMPGYTDQSIFLPAAGYIYDMNLLSARQSCLFWSSSLDTAESLNSCYLFLFNMDPRCMFGPRFVGQSVRPVCPKEKYNNPVSSIELNKTEISMCIGGKTVQINAIPKDADGNEVSAVVNWHSSDEGYVTVSKDGLVAASGAIGTCTISASVGLVKTTCEVTITPGENGYGFVDLGLSVKWATLNVGANSQEEYGDYYSWGDVEPLYERGYAQENPQTHWKSTTIYGYSWSDYKYCHDASSNTITKYCVNSVFGYNGFIDGKKELDPEDDVAHVVWEGNWRMPTNLELDELIDGCIWTWTAVNGVDGYRVTSKYNNQSIFLPASGSRSGKDLSSFGSRVFYWSSSIGRASSTAGQSLYSSTSRVSIGDTNRSCGQSVRPVLP